MRIVVRPKAKDDIVEHAVYIALDSIHKADQFLIELEQSFRRLCEMPFIGIPCRLKSRKLANVRVWQVHRFPRILIFYRSSRKLVDIIRILHSARDIENILRV